MSDAPSNAASKYLRSAYAFFNERGSPSEEVMREFRRVDAAIAKVFDMKDIFADEHFRQRGMIAEVDGIVMQNVVAGMSKTPGRLRYPGRPFDADTKAVLARFAKPSKTSRRSK